MFSRFSLECHPRMDGSAEGSLELSLVEIGAAG